MHPFSRYLFWNFYVYSFHRNTSRAWSNQIASLLSSGFRRAHYLLHLLSWSYHYKQCRKTSFRNLLNVLEKSIRIRRKVLCWSYYMHWLINAKRGRIVLYISTHKKIFVQNAMEEKEMKMVIVCLSKNGGLSHNYIFLIWQKQKRNSCSIFWKPK